MINVTVQLENKNVVVFKARTQKHASIEAITQVYPTWAKIRKTEGRYLEKTTITHRNGSIYSL